jgi:hypothetical protein
MSLQQDRRRFNAQTAPVLAERVGVPGSWNGHGSERFAYFCDDQRLVIVAGPQEGRYVDLAFAQGLEHRGSRRLVLILPQEHAFATLQRAPYAEGDRQEPGSQAPRITADRAG